MLQYIDFYLLGDLNLLHRVDASNKVSQMSLSLQWKESFMSGRPQSFDEVEFRNFSQNGEDGLLLYIFSLIKPTNKKVVEICAGDGIECNAANLIVHHGWNGLLFDGDKKNIERGNRFYARCRDTFSFPPKVVQAWITKDNVNALISDNGFKGEIDLLSLDLDGNDYWILDAINVVSPRVIILEYLDAMGPTEAVTIPYKADFVCDTSNQLGMEYYGASLPAYAKLLKKRGYRLIGGLSMGLNAVFMRNDVGIGVFEEADMAQMFRHERILQRMRTLREKLLERDWINV
ncbi:MAG TPA: hypothetical protein VK470_13690 [Bacteroidota bacterium]|nr:hypothetical protein [Bacteroidota bacterium]